MGTSYNPRIITDGLVLCLDAANKRSYPGAGTAWSDLTNNNHNGTLENNAAFTSANGGGIAFDGTDDRVTIDDFEDLNATDASFSCGLKLDALGSDREILVKGSHSGSSPLVLFYDESVGGGQGAGNSNAISFLSADGGTQIFFSSPSSSVSAGEIFVVDVTIDASAGKVSLYKNGQLLASQTDSDYDGMPNTSDDYHLGADSGFNKDLQGNIYFFRAYNKCLSASEVRQNYLATKGRYK